MMKSNNLQSLETNLIFLFYLELNSSAGTQRLPPKCVLLCQVTLNMRCQTYEVYRTFLSPCGFIVFDPYIIQNPRGKSSNSILVLNTLLHDKQGTT